MARLGEERVRDYLRDGARMTEHNGAEFLLRKILEGLVTEPYLAESCRHVVNGAKWLDEILPGWERRVDASVLDIGDGTTCICGQVLPGGWHDKILNNKDSQWLWNHGFLNPMDGDQWVDLLKKRFNSGLLSDQWL